MKLAVGDSQREKTLRLLQFYGRVDNVMAKSKGISRLPVQIKRLRRQGYRIEFVSDPSRYYRLMPVDYF